MVKTVLALGLSLAVALAADCDVKDFKENVFTLNSFAADDMKLVAPATLSDEGAIWLTKKELNGGVPSYAWLTKKERVADGFLATYTYQFDGLADGFAFVVQNDKITNINSGVGDKLGFDGIRRSLAIGLDMCPGRPGDCDSVSPNVIVISRDENGTEIASQVQPVTDLVIDDGESHTVEVLYSVYKGTPPNTGTVSVSIDGTELVTDTFVGQLEDIFGSRFAYIGFTGSTLYDDNVSADSYISSLTVDQLPSNTFVPVPEEPNRVLYNETVSMDVVFRDACQDPLAELPLPSDEIVIEAYLTEQVTEEGLSPIVLVPDLEFNDNGNVTMVFYTPNFVKAKWDLSVVVNGVVAAGSPYTSVLETIQPTFEIAGLDPSIFALLLVLLVFLIILIAVVVCKLQSYRKKLKENDEFIKAGQEQAKLEKLEDGMTFSNNPMMGSIDELKKQLEDNQKELAQLRNRDFGSDDEHTVAQLERQRNELLAEMNRLKREEQEEQANAQTFTGANTGGLGRKRVEFNPMQANEF